MNGNNTLPENVADNGGLHASFQVSLKDTIKISIYRGMYSPLNIRGDCGNNNYMHTLERCRVEIITVYYIQ